MPWAQFDDHAGDSLPFLRAGGEALGLHLLATLWSAEHLTDGVVPTEVVKLYGARFRSPEAMIDRLTDAGLWERVEDGYRLTDFLAANRSRAQVEADQAKKRAAASKGGRTKAERDRKARAATEMNERP